MYNKKMHQKFLEEKASQVEHGGLTAFGIKIHSRYDRASEIAEMFNFAEAACKAGVSPYINTVFYDSQACFCQFEFGFESSDDFSEILEKIKTCAFENISQFVWRGYALHGAALRFEGR